MVPARSALGTQIRFTVMSRRNRLMVCGVCLGGWIASVAAQAVANERHFEEVRALLVVRSANCTSCHSDAAGSSLNAYGQGLSALSKDLSLDDRILRMESVPRIGASEEDRREQSRRQDIDGDGVRNWVEILAGKDPADDKNKPSRKQIERIERVVSCSICHSATNLPGKEEGLAANPHNELGALLAQTVPKPRPGEARPKGERETRAAAERVSILTRLGLTRTKRPKGSKATYWQRIRLLFSPTDTARNPSAEELKAFKKAAAIQRSPRRRDPTKGVDCDAHRLGGFLEETTGLD